MHLLLAGAALALVVAYASPAWRVPAVAVLGLGVWRSLARRPRGHLRVVPCEAGGLAWSWRPAGEEDWRSVGVRCDYLGPWLIGLRLAGRRLWLWPDSADPEALRALRRRLVQVG